MVTILVIEGDQSVRELICEVLEGAGYEVVLAITGDAGLYGLRGEPEIEMVILNSYLPDMSGLEFARSVKLEFPGVKLLLSTGASEEVGTKALAEGFDAVLYKPIGIKYLVSRVKDLLSK